MFCFKNEKKGRNFFISFFFQYKKTDRGIMNLNTQSEIQNPEGLFDFESTRMKIVGVYINGSLQMVSDPPDHSKRNSALCV